MIYLYILQVSSDSLTAELELMSTLSNTPRPLESSNYSSKIEPSITLDSTINTVDSQIQSQSYGTPKSIIVITKSPPFSTPGSERSQSKSKSNPNQAPKSTRSDRNKNNRNSKNNTLSSNNTPVSGNKLKQSPNIKMRSPSPYDGDHNSPSTRYKTREEVRAERDSDREEMRRIIEERRKEIRFKRLISNEKISSVEITSSQSSYHPPKSEQNNPKNSDIRFSDLEIGDNRDSNTSSFPLFISSDYKIIPMELSDKDIIGVEESLLSIDEPFQSLSITQNKITDLSQSDSFLPQSSVSPTIEMLSQNGQSNIQLSNDQVHADLRMSQAQTVLAGLVDSENIRDSQEDDDILLNNLNSSEKEYTDYLNLSGKHNHNHSIAIPDKKPTISSAYPMADRTESINQLGLTTEYQNLAISEYTALFDQLNSIIALPFQQDKQNEGRGTNFKASSLQQDESNDTNTKVNSKLDITVKESDDSSIDSEAFEDDIPSIHDEEFNIDEFEEFSYDLTNTSDLNDIKYGFLDNKPIDSTVSQLSSSLESNKSHNHIPKEMTQMEGSDQLLKAHNPSDFVDLKHINLVDIDTVVTRSSFLNPHISDTSATSSTEVKGSKDNISESSAYLKNQLEMRLIESLGSDIFQTVIQKLNNVYREEVENIDEDRLLQSIEEVVGVNGLQYLDDLLTYLTLE
jgi:hypothetical protein